MTARSIASLLACVALTGCATDPRPIDELPPDTPPPPGHPFAVAAPPGPVEVLVPIAQPEGFRVEDLSARGDSPVVAVTPDGRLHHAYVDDSSWPVVGRAGATAVPLPGDRAPTTAVAAIASADGTVHVAWDPGGEIRYTRLQPDGSFDEPIVLDSGFARDPNLAMTRAGEVVAAWTFEPELVEGEARSPAQIRVARGAVVGGSTIFEVPVVANDGCCFNELGDPAERVSGPSLAVGPDDSIHVVYEWSTYANTTIEYVHDRDGGFGAPVQISNAAFVPCPAINVDSDGVAHITFLRELDPGVFYVTVADGELSEETVLYVPEAGRVTMALAYLDAEGVLHLGVTEHDGSAYRLLYRKPGAETEIMTMEGAMIELTPRAGGMLATPDGSLAFSFATGSRNEPRPVHYALGR